jgi:excisionase family DNA binding protein
MLSKKAMVEKDKNEGKMPELLTLQEACDVLKCHPNTLRQWDKNGTLPAIRIGVKRVRRYQKKDITNFCKPSREDNEEK